MRVLSVGFNDSRQSAGTTAELVGVFGTSDWALAMPGERVLAKVRQRLSELMPLPHRLAHRCTVDAPWPFSGCWNWQTVTLTDLDVDLSDGGFRLAGAISVNNSGALIPGLTATFSALASLSVTSSGMIAVAVSSVSVTFGEFYADVANFLLGDALKTRLEEAIRIAIQGGAAGNVLSEFIAQPALLQLLSIGSMRDLGIEASLRSVSIWPSVVMAQGDLRTPKSRRAPEVTLAPVPVAGREYILNAKPSWAPGGVIAQYEWRHSDQTNSSTQGDSCRFVEKHEFGETPVGPGMALMTGFAPRSYSCLRVTDDHGKFTETCITVIPARRPEIQIGPFSLLPRFLQAPDLVFPRVPPRPWPAWKAGNRSSGFGFSSGGVSAHSVGPFAERVAIVPAWEGRMALPLLVRVPGERQTVCRIRVASLGGWFREETTSPSGLSIVYVPLQELPSTAARSLFVTDAIIVSTLDMESAAIPLVVWLTTEKDRADLAVGIAREAARVKNAARRDVAMGLALAVQRGATPAEILTQSRVAIDVERTVQGVAEVVAAALSRVQEQLSAISL